MQRYIRIVYCILMICLVHLSAWSEPETHGPTMGPKRILVLFSYNYNFVSQQQIIEGLESARKIADMRSCEFVHEYLDFLFKDKELTRVIRNQLLKKYADQRFDLIITIFEPAFDFLLNEGSELLPETPCLSLFAIERPNVVRAGQPVVQIPLSSDPEGTLALALKFFPKTRKIYFVSGANQSDKSFEAEARKIFAPWGKKLEFDYTGNRSVDDMLKTVAQLKPGNIVIYSRVSSDITGKMFVPGDVVSVVAKVSPVPVFCLVSSHIDTGVMGGSLIDFEALGEMLNRATLALGEGKPLAIEPASRYIKPMFNWLQIRRWNINPDLLPKDSIIINRPPTFWQQYRQIAVGSMMVFVCMAVLIVALLIKIHNKALIAEIGERKQVQRMVLSANAYNRGLIEASLDPLVTIGLDGTITDVNLATEYATGCRRDELIGTDFTNYFTEPERARTVYQQVFKEGCVQDYELNIRRRDGSTMPVRYNASIYKDNSSQQIGVFAAARDITKLKQAEEALQLANAYNRSLLEASLDPLVTIGPDGRITDANKATELATGCKREELIGTDFADNFTDPDQARAGYLQAFKDGHVKDYALYLRRCDGSPIPVLYNASVYRDKNGQVIGVFAAARDITRIKQAEEERLDLERKLHQAKKAESLGRMAGAIAHNYNNMLSVVMGNLELFMEFTPLSAPASEMLTGAMKAARRAADLSSLMLTFLGQTSGNHEPMDFSVICRDFMPTLKESIPKDVNFETNLLDSGPFIKANAFQIRQILTHLITNAVESMDEHSGFIRLNVKTVSPADIPETYRWPLEWRPQDNHYACLEVADSGSGISAETMEKLFDPFFTSKFTGRGLGLPVVLGIVRAHGGAVAVESKLNKGSVFRIVLPVSAEEIKRQPAMSVKSHDISEGCTVLLVEDDPAVRKMAGAMLDCLGFKVLEAKDGVDALDVYRQNKDVVRVVLSDLTMPRMDGWTTLEALHRIDPDLPVILVSGYDQAQVMEGDHSDLPQAFLNKPYQLAELRETISHVLKKKQSGG